MRPAPHTAEEATPSELRGASLRLMLMLGVLALLVVPLVRDLPVGKASRIGLLAWLLVVCVLVQVFLAGLFVFESREYIEDHQTFVHFFEFVPWIMLLLVFIGALGRTFAIHSFVLGMLIGLQYAFAEAENGMVGALHVVNALLIFWLAVATAIRVTRALRSLDGRV